MQQMSFLNNQRKLIAANLCVEDEYLISLILFFTKPWFVFNRDCTFVEDKQNFIHSTSVAKVLKDLPKKASTLPNYLKRKYPKGVPGSFKLPSDDEYARIRSFLSAVEKHKDLDITIII